MTTPKALGQAFHQATITLLLLLTLSHHASAQQQSPDSHRPLTPSTAIILIVITGIFFVLGCVCIFIRQRSESRISRTLTSSFVRMAKPNGLDAEAIKAFPTFLYSQVKNHKIGRRALECAVCLCEFEDHDTLRFLPKCNHVFHADCIDSWLESHVTCPVCRADLVPKPGETCIGPTIEPDEPATTDVRPEIISPNRGIFRDGYRTLWWTPLQFGRFFPRSHSTGHSLIQNDRDCERFMLVLPEDVRTELIKTTLLKRTKSCQFDFPRMGSPKTGLRSPKRGYNFSELFNLDGRIDRWEFSATPPFIRKCRSTRFQGSENNERKTSLGRSLTKSTTMPVRSLFTGRDSDGERSFDRLRPNSQV